MKTNNFTDQFQFSSKAKNIGIVAIVVGLATIAFGLLTNPERTFANLLLMSYYTTCVTLGATFFLAVQLVTQAGWSAGILRIPQAFARIVPLMAAVFIVITLVGLLTHNLYHHWNAHGIADPTSEHFDKIIAKKASYLNMPFFMTRTVLLLGIYALFAGIFTKLSYKQDVEGGMLAHKKSFKTAAIFLVVFGFTYPLFAFDAIMSLEAHWFSTLFGWYNFAGMWVSSLCAIALTMIVLKEKGYFNWVTENHLHDLGKFIFGFSIFWSYLWFSQFILIYYANIPEETVYFFKRWEPEYKPWFWLNIVMNFLTPFLVLMTRDAKRNFKTMKFITIFLLLGHWLDYYVMIMPGTVAEHRGFGIIEIGVAVGFVGLISTLMLSALSKQSLLPKNHPMLDESLHHHI